MMYTHFVLISTYNHLVCMYLCMYVCSMYLNECMYGFTTALTTSLCTYVRMYVNTIGCRPDIQVDLTYSPSMYVCTHLCMYGCMYVWFLQCRLQIHEERLGRKRKRSEFCGIITMYVYIRIYYIHLMYVCMYVCMQLLIMCMLLCCRKRSSFSSIRTAK
jgi:hypothetical protein